MLDVGADFIAAQGIQMVADGNALAQLAQAVLVEPVPQLRLPHEHDLQKLPFIGFEIGQQPHLLQQLRRQVLRLVDDQDSILVALDLLEQKPVDFGDGFQAVQPLDLQIQLHRDGLHQLIGVHDGVENERRGKARPQLLEQRPAKRRLSRPDFAGQLDKPLALANAIKKMIKGLAMFGAEEQKPRIGRDIKGRFLQPVILEIHTRLIAQKADGEKTIV